jgi:hypothetical protein
MGSTSIVAVQLPWYTNSEETVTVTSRGTSWPPTCAKGLGSTSPGRLVAPLVALSKALLLDVHSYISAGSSPAAAW